MFGSLSTWQVLYPTHPDPPELDRSIFCPLQSSAYVQTLSAGPVCTPRASSQPVPLLFCTIVSASSANNQAPHNGTNPTEKARGEKNFKK